MSCPLCEANGGALLWRDAFCRILRIDEPGYPGFLRVVLNRHVAEMTDLEPQDRERLMNCVYAAETTLRTLVRPDKVNLASLGNVVPHLHWHVIGRSRDDSRFPDSVWSPPRREVPAPAGVFASDSSFVFALAGLLGPGESAPGAPT